MNSLDRNQDGRIDLNDLKSNQSSNLFNDQSGRTTGLAPNQPLPNVGGSTNYSSSVPLQQGNTDFVPSALPSSLQKEPNWMNSTQSSDLEREKISKKEAKRIKKEQKWSKLSDEEKRIKMQKKEAKKSKKLNSSKHITTAAPMTQQSLPFESNRQWSSHFPQGIPPQHLKTKRELHRELVGWNGVNSNGLWNLKKAQTRSYGPMEYYNMEKQFQSSWDQQQSTQRSIPFDNTQQWNQSNVNSSLRSSQVRTLPTEVERIQKNVVVHEHIHPVEKEEIQPIITVERVQMAPEVRQPIVERSAPIQENIALPSRDIDMTARSSFVKPAIVNETVRRTVVEEVQPVLERDVIQPSVIRETQPIYEKVIEAPHVQRETLPMRELGVSNAQTGRAVSTPFQHSTSSVPASNATYAHSNSSYVPQQNVGLNSGSTSSFVPTRMADYAAEGGSITHAEGFLSGGTQASYGQEAMYQPAQYGTQGIAPQQFASSVPQQQYRTNLPQQFSSVPQQTFNTIPSQSFQQSGFQQRTTVVPPRMALNNVNTFGGFSQFAAEGGPITFAQSGGLNRETQIKTIDPNLMSQTMRQQPPTFYRQM
eukprot:TRINITY_DN2313_c0_g1_i2.p1 TRINITY_DN2313_c0_g1~~TRINITY_DN2313_c0_g1_i2.p1  ORF type:complete len:590 (+),score=240.77 TRINITY_DN2313_c0_g1_i2:368-2137(+)